MSSFLIPGLITVTTMSLLVAALYLHLFLNNKDRILQLWSAAWGVYSLRFLIQTSMVLHILPPWMVVLQETATLAGALLCFAGSKAFTDKPAASWWWYGAGIFFSWVVFAQIVHLPFFWADLPISFFTGLLFFWSGIIILRQTQIRGPGRKVSGYALVLWGIHRADYTFLRHLTWFAPWGFLLAAVLFLTAAIGILLLYYDKIRADLEREIHERKLAQKSFSASEEDLKESQRIARLGIWRLDVSTNQVVWSKELYKMYDFNPELPPPPYTEHQKLFTAESWKKLSTALNKTKEEGIPYELELKTVRKDGSHGWMWVHGEALRDESDAIFMLRGAAQDITERKQAEEELRESKERHRTILATAMDGFWIVDTLGRFLEVNETYCEMSGYAEHEILRMVISDVEDVETAADTAARMQKVMAEGQDRFESRHRRKDGSVFDVEVSVQYRPSDEPKCVVFIRDITDRKMAETQRAAIQRELVKRNQFIEMVLDSLPIGLGVNYADSGEVTYLNKKFVEIYGWPKTDFPNVADFFDKVFPDPIKREILRKKILEDIASGDPDRMVWEDLEITTKTGKKRIVSAVNIPIIDQNLMISTVQDLTEKRKLEAHIHQTRKMESIGNLAGGIAHDFNNILSSIIGFTELALDEAHKGTTLEDSLQEVYSAGKRAKELVKQILAFARQSDEKKTPIQPSMIAKEVLRLIRSTIPATIEINQEIESESWIMGNATQIHQVLLNLCTNAADAMEESDGVLSVRVRDVFFDQDRLSIGIKPGNYIEVEVSDTGSGIAPEIIGSIFEPYFTTKGFGEGTGMGLAMVHGIIESYGGKISVHSQLGKGTIFKVYLPITKKRSSRDAYIPEKLPTGTERILFVDDESAIAKSGSLILEGLGYCVTTRTSSIEALELFLAKPNDFDLVLTDMTMPKMTGDKLAIELMKIRPNIPVVLCTGYSKKISDETASEIGIKALAYKPVVKADLAKTVRKILDAGRSES